MTSQVTVAAPRRRFASLIHAVSALPRWVVLLFAAVAVRAITFGNPLVHVDEGFYFVTAERMLHGALPFVDVWDRKPVGLFLLYMPAAAFGVPAGIWVYQMMALASVVGTALLIARLAEAAGWGRAALVSALLYLFCINFGDGQGGQAPVFYNLLMAWAVLLIVPRPAMTERERMRRGLAALALVGISLQIKYSVVFEGMFLGLWLLWREWTLKTPMPRIVAYGAALIGIAMVPTVAALLSYVAIGQTDAFLYANFGSILSRHSDPADVLARAFLKLILILGPLLVMSGLSRHVPVNREEEHPVRRLLFGWLIASCLGVLVFGSYFNHYALPVMVPASVCSAGFLGGNRIGRRIAPLMVAIALFGGEYTVWSAMQHRGNAREFQAIVDSIGRGPGCLYVYSGSAMYYAYTDRCAVTSWIFPSHLTRDRENGALGVDQIEEVNRIFARKPEIVVAQPPFSGERQVVHDLAMSYVRRDYRPRGRYLLGDLMIDVFERKPEASPARSASRPS